MITSPTKNVRGFLLRSFTGNSIFRVYDENHNFIDYHILHHDLEVTINSDDALFYEDGDKRFIDYTPAVLGYKE